MKISIGLVAGVKGSVTNRLKEVKNKTFLRLLVVTFRKQARFFLFQVKYVGILVAVVYLEISVV